MSGILQGNISTSYGAAGGGDVTATAYATSVSGRIISNDDEAGDYAAARNGTALLSTGTSNIIAGQAYIGGVTNYIVYEGFLNFDLVAAGFTLGQTCSDAHLSLWPTTDGSTTDFSIEARTRNWGDTLTTGDWVAGGSLGALTLLASLTTAGIATGAYVEITESGTELKDAVTDALAADGILRMILCSSRTVINTTPTGGESITFAPAGAGASPEPKVTATCA